MSKNIKSKKIQEREKEGNSISRSVSKTSSKGSVKARMIDQICIYRLWLLRRHAQLKFISKCL